jgi:hypothetical protein
VLTLRNEFLRALQGHGVHLVEGLAELHVHPERLPTGSISPPPLPNHATNPQSQDRHQQPQSRC